MREHILLKENTFYSECDETRVAVAHLAHKALGGFMSQVLQEQEQARGVVEQERALSLYLFFLFFVFFVE